MSILIKKIKILHIISNLGQGGAEEVLYQLLFNLNTVDFSHTVICFHTGIYTKKIRKLGIKVFVVPRFFCAYDPLFLYQLFTFIKKNNPDIVHTSLWSANIIGRIYSNFLRIPHLQVLHNNIDQNGRLRILLDRWITYKKSKTIAVSYGILSSVKECISKSIADNISVIKNGISHTSYSDTKKIVRSDIGLSDNEFIIGSVGRFEIVKNYGLLLESFSLVIKKHSNTRLVLVGYGSQEKFLRQKAYDLKIHDYVSFIIGENAFPYYNIFDCFVSSSIKEGISIALLEAMSKEVPVIVCSETVHHDVIKNRENGLVVCPIKYDNLSRSITVLVEDSSLREIVIFKAKKTLLSDFTIEKMIESYASIYRLMATQKNS